MGLLPVPAQFFKHRFAHQGLNMILPDLNQNDFFHLTLTRQIKQVQTFLPDLPVMLIGSSFGGLLALWLAEKQPQIQCLILLAPALNFINHTIAFIGEQQYIKWRQDGKLAFYHYAQQRELLLNYNFIEDMQRYQDNKLQRCIPTLILHGCHDEVIPISTSRDFVATRPWIELIELESDHSLNDVQPQLWETMVKFLSKTKAINFNEELMLRI